MISTETEQATVAHVSAQLAQHQPALQRRALELCGGNVADASDLVQDTCEKALRRGIPVAVRNPRVWLAKMMTNLFFDRCRYDKRRPAEPLGALEDLPMPVEIQPAWDRITKQDIREAAEALPRGFRDVYLLKEFEGLRYEDIAARLRIDRLTVGSRLTRARGLLREILVQRFGAEVAE